MKVKTDSTIVPEDAAELLSFDSDSDDEDRILVGRGKAGKSWLTARDGLCLDGKLLDDQLFMQDKSPWSSPVGATAVSGNFGDLSNWDNQAPEPSKIVPSVGSELHGTGDCKPCAWFWKSQGCQNGRECLHCHLCPKSEVKAKKKMRARDRKVAQLEEEAAEAVASGLFRPPPGLTPFCAPLQPPPGLIAEEPQAERIKLFIPLDAGSEATTEEGSLVASEPGSPESEQKEADTEDMAGVSVGSALHLSGRCKPCAWFWKPQGCEHGADCLHCHLCPQGEVKRRKKQKKAAAQEADAEELDQLSEPTATSASFQAQQMLIQQQQEQLMQMQFQLQLQQMQLSLHSQALAQATLASAPACLPGEAKLRTKAKQACLLQSLA